MYPSKSSVSVKLEIFYLSERGERERERERERRKNKGLRLSVGENGWWSGRWGGGGGSGERGENKNVIHRKLAVSHTKP